MDRFKFRCSELPQWYALEKDGEFIGYIDGRAGDRLVREIVHACNTFGGFINNDPAEVVNIFDLAAKRTQQIGGE
jgi:hypothetical protein